MLLEKFRYVHYPPTKFPKFEFDSEKCTHCKACALSCPTSCIQWDEEKKIPYPTGLSAMKLACLGCNNCEAVCPVGAVRARGEYRVLKGRYKTPDDKQGEMIPPIPFGENDLTRNFEEIEKDLNEVERVIYRRRSIRLFGNKLVSEDLIHRIIEAARWAPSGGNCLPWKFIVVTNKTLIDKVNRQCSKFVMSPIQRVCTKRNILSKLFVTLYSYFRVNEMDQRPMAAIEKIKQSGNAITFDAPVVIHVLKDIRGISKPELDTGIAAQNLVLAAHSLGLGTCYIGFIATAIKFLPWLKKELGIKYPYELTTSVCVGYPRGKLDNPVWRARVPVEWIR
jgi:nitroreductase/Pyruvate/2-oxoacid:ferredoxin oxidoreductase delta subunit